MDDLKFLPEIEKIFKEVKAAGGPLMWEVSTEELRGLRNPFITGTLGPTRKIHQVTEHMVPHKDADIPCRLYRPSEAKGLPCLVYYHGGGWVVGDLETHDNLCRKLCLAVGCAVFSVGYRLAPEHKYPAAKDDAFNALVWLYENAAGLGLDPGRLAVGGDSCGGNLAAVVSLMARDMGGPALKLQLLVYPATDVSGFERPTYAKYGDDLLLTKSGMQFFTGCYLNESDEAKDPLVSPLLASSLEGLPPALVITAEHDVLTSDGEDYSQALGEAGVLVQYKRFPGTIHLFFGMEALSAQENGLDLAAKALKEAFGLDRA